MSRKETPDTPDRLFDYSRLTSAELEAALNTLVGGTAPAEEKVDWMQRLIHELQVHRCELEMQNRALKEARDDLEQAVHRYADLYDSLPIGYVTMTLSGRIVEANESAAELLHRDREQLPGTYMRSFVGEQNAAAFATHIAESGRTDQRHTIELSLEVPQGAATWVQLSSRRAHGTHRETMIRTALTDVSALKETQSALRDVIAEQESFVYSVSHDLRAPLVTIAQFAGLLNDGSVSGTEPTRDVIDRIRRAASRMDALLQAVLEFSRVSQKEVGTEEVDCGEVVAEVLQQHQGIVAGRGATIEVQPGLPVAYGSKCLLIQVVSNLVTNALKYAAKGKAPVVRITANATGRTVVLCVADEGIGIPQHQHERIFRLFERLHGPTDYPGSGIGLALVRRAVEKMHGRIWVESQVGQGSRFFVELPKPGT